MVSSQSSILYEGMIYILYHKGYMRESLRLKKSTQSRNVYNIYGKNIRDFELPILQCYKWLKCIIKTKLTVDF